jgi:preprotein translocase subunit SecE
LAFRPKDFELNREEKRRLQRQGQLGPDATPVAAGAANRDAQTRRVRQAGQRQVSSGSSGSRLSNTMGFFRDTRGELRKVAWPTRAEVRNYSVVVLATLVLLITLIFVLDYLASNAILELFHT